MTRLGFWLFALGLLSGCGPQDGPLLSREDLFGNPSRTQMRLSPDGTQMSFLSPSEGVLTIWVGPAGDIAAAQPLPFASVRGTKFHMWLEDNKTILFEQDASGNENWRVFVADLATGATRDLTPVENAQAKMIGWSRNRPNEIVVGLNDRDPRWHDPYLIDIRTGERTLLMRNDRFQSFMVDHDLNLRFAIAPRGDGGLLIYQREAEEWREVFAVPPEDALNFSFVEFDAENKHVTLLDSRGRNTTSLWRYAPTTGEMTLIGQNDTADIDIALLDPKTQMVQAHSAIAARREWVVIDPAIEADLVAISTAAKGEFLIVDRTDDDSRWIVYVDRVKEPGAYYIYYRAAKTLNFAFSTRPELEKADLRPMHVAEITARDGLALTGYYTLPRHADKDEDGVAERPAPLALVVHGGPWSRDEYRFQAWHQWLANRGYAVLSVNFRGSTGFGKAFLNAGDRQWGAKMQDDLIDAVAWAKAGGIAQADKVAIMGGSYGGYAALAGLTFAPESFSCGISIVGPPSLPTFLQSLPPYWQSMKETFRRRIGDPDTPEGRRDLEARSPLYHAGAIRAPVLIGQGARDPRVNIKDTDEFVRQLRKSGVPVTYVLYPDEGHYFSQPANQLSFFAVADQFLSDCLGGRAEPIGAAFKGSSIEVLEGADKVPGLADAIAALGQSDD